MIKLFWDLKFVPKIILPKQFILSKNLVAEQISTEKIVNVDKLFRYKLEIVKR